MDYIVSIWNSIVLFIFPNKLTDISIYLETEPNLELKDRLKRIELEVNIEKTKKLFIETTKLNFNSINNIHIIIHYINNEIIYINKKFAIEGANVEDIILYTNLNNLLNDFENIQNLNEINSLLEWQILKPKIDHQLGFQ